MVKKRVRRQFDAEFKVEAVRRMEERQAVKVPLTTIARDLDVRPEQLRMWADQLAAERGKPASEVFPGEGCVTGEAAEIRRLQREVETLRMERDFLKKASADSTGQGNRDEERVGRRRKAERLSRALIEFTCGTIQRSL